MTTTHVTVPTKILRLQSSYTRFVVRPLSSMNVAWCSLALADTPYTLNPKPEALSPKPETLSPKPNILNPNHSNLGLHRILVCCQDPGPGASKALLGRVIIDANSHKLLKT